MSSPSELGVTKDLNKSIMVKYVFLLSFEHNIPEIPYLTNEHQEKRTAGMYEMLNVLKMYRISRCGQPNEGR